MRIRFVDRDGSDFYEDLADTGARLIRRMRPARSNLIHPDPRGGLYVPIDVYRRVRRYAETFYQYDSTL